MDITLPPSAILSHTRQLFDHGGALAAVVPNYTVNDKQVEFASLVADAVGAPDPLPGQGGELTLLEAGTGTGKTIGYLAPLALNAALTGERAMISTHTNHLARQILDVDGPKVIDAVERITGKRPTLAQRIGRANFVDHERVADLLALLRDEGATSQFVTPLQLWLDARPETFADAAELGLELPPGVATEDIRLTAGSSQNAQVAYRQHVAASAAADIMVTNHALALIDAQMWSRVLNSDGRIRVAVFDEADTLPQVARANAESRLSIEEISSLCDRLPGNGRSPASVALRRLREIAKGILGHDAIIVERGKHEDLIAAVNALTDALRDTPTHNTDLSQEARRVLHDLADWAEALDGSVQSAALLVPAPIRKRPGLARIDVDPARVLSRLWSCGRDGREPFLRTAVFVSATLSAPTLRTGASHFTPFMHEIGIDPSWSNFASRRSRSVTPPRKFGTLTFVLADRDVPAPIDREEDEDGDVITQVNPDWLEYAASGIRAAQAQGGRTLVLAASYDDATALAERTPRAILHQRGMKLGPLLDTFRASSSATLITPAAWAGVSLPGIINHLVIPRVPFGAPDPARDAAMIRAMVARGKTERQAKGILLRRAAAEARRRLRQGIGRLIRTPTDEGTLWILDPRFPLHEKRVRDPRARMHLGASVGHHDLAMCIPERFRNGLRSNYEMAAIHPWVR